eukprot:CAMPEP_0196215056 /NCGR_PEP_ID=MMETSP0912-20130531/29045_1 /TAXON_ID=49265 /ORGANISM="Thalassiosira rotula, Strain GSO102" /LENGTH=47 /DNA_ID= /DNA_START= /DNA_END= /DNA_ORIENTATION=
MIDENLRRLLRLGQLGLEGIDAITAPSVPSDGGGLVLLQGGDDALAL